MDSSPFAATIGAAFFWGFLAVAVIFGTISSWLINREKQRTLRAAIEKGNLDAKALDRLMQPSGGSATEEPENLILGGCVTVAGGLALLVLSFFVPSDEARQVLPGVAAMAAIVGVTIAGFGVWAMKRRDRQPKG